MAVKFANNVSTTLSAAINATQTTIGVADASGLPAMSSGDYFYLTIDTDTASPTLEVVKVTGIVGMSGTALTVVRGQDGTTASSFSSGTKIELRVTTAALDDIASQAQTAADTESVSIDGDTMTGTLNMGANAITSTGSIASGAITSTELTITGGTGDADIYINNTSPTLAFTDSNSFSDANDKYIIRGGSTGKLQFQWLDDSAGTTTQTFLIDQSGNADFAGAITSTGSSSFGDVAVGGAADSNYDLKVYGLARFQGAANFVSATNPIQVGGVTVIDASRNITAGTINSGAITAGVTSAFGPLSGDGGTTLKISKASGSSSGLKITNSDGQAHTWFGYTDGNNYITADADLTGKTFIRYETGNVYTDVAEFNTTGIVFSKPITSTGNMSLSNSGTGNNITINRTDSSTSAVFHIGSSRGYVGTTTDHEFEIRQNDTPAITIDTSGNTTVENNLVVDGNLTVSGTTTTLNTATLDVEDKNITLNYSTGDSSASADGAGITIQDAVNGSTDATILWNASSDLFNFSHKINVQGDVQAYNFYGQDVHVLNSAGTGWHEWATRANDKVTLDVSNISSGTITSTGQFLSKVVSYSANQSGVYATAASTAYTGASTHWGTHGARHTIKTNSGGVPRITVDWEGGEKYSLDNSGNATFAGDLRVKNSGRLYLWNDHSLNYIQYNHWQGSASAGMTIKNIAGTGDLILGSGNATALTLDSSQNATFAGTISSGAITSSGHVQASTLSVNHTGALSGTQVYIKKADASTNLMRWGEGTSGQDTYRFRIDQSFNFIGNSGSGDNIILNSDNGNIRGTSFNIGSTTVISSSRNLTNIGTITSSHSQHNGFTVTATDSTANAAFSAMKLDYNLSGSDACTTDRNHIGLHLDVDSSASGGLTNHEHRIYGIFSDVRASGDSDLVWGIQSTARVDDFGAGNQITQMGGAYGQSNAHNANGVVALQMGGYNYALNNSSGTGQVTNTRGAANLAYAASTSNYNGATYIGSHNMAQISAAQTADISQAVAVWGEVQLDNDAATDHNVTISNAFVFRAEYDENDSNDSYTVNTGYLYYGNYAGTQPTTAYGVYIADGVRNYFGGTLTAGLASTAAVSYGFNGDLNTGMYSPANHQLGLVVNGSRKLLLDSTGVAVQTGNLTVTGPSGFNANQETASIYLGDTNSEIRATYNGGTRFFLNGTDRMELEGGTGNLNLKTGALEINGTTVIDSSRNLTNIEELNATGRINISAGTGITDSYVQLGITNTASSAGLFLDASNGGRKYEIQSTTPGELIFYDRDSQAYRLRIMANGNLKIESGNLQMGGTTVIDASRNGTFGTTLSVGNSTGGNFVLKRPSANYIWADQTAGYLVFGTNGLGTSLANSSLHLDASKNAVFGGSITSSGAVNVGDGTAQSKITIKKADNNLSDHLEFYNGTTRIGEIGCQDTTWLRINQETNKNIYTPRYIRADNGFFVDSTNYGITGAAIFKAADGTVGAPGISFGLDTNCGLYRVTTDTIGISTGGAQRQRWHSSGTNVTGDMTASGNVTAYSDERLKSDIKTASSEAVYQMRGTAFIKDNRAGAGVIAQELERVTPHLVHEQDDGYKSVDYMGITAYLIEAVKSQKETIDQLVKRIEDLENGNH